MNRTELTEHLHTHPEHAEWYAPGHDFMLRSTADIRREHDGWHAHSSVQHKHSVPAEEHAVIVDAYRQRIARLRNALLAVGRGTTDHVNAALAAYALEEDDYIAQPGHDHESEAARKRHESTRKILDGMIGAKT